MKRFSKSVFAFLLFAAGAVSAVSAAGLSLPVDGVMPVASASAAPLPAALFVAGDKKVRTVSFLANGPNCKDFERHHVYDKWTLSKAKVIETKFVADVSAEIWGDNELVISGEVAKPTQECGSWVNQAYVKVRLEYTEDEDE